MKDRLVVIGANDFQNQLIVKAKEKGYETHVFAWKDGSIGEKTADFFYPISIIEKEEILEKVREIKPKGIVSIASDLATVTVNYVANELNLVGNSNVSTLVSTNKYEMRKAFLKNHIPSPKFYVVDKDFDVDTLLKINYNLDMDKSNKDPNVDVLPLSFPVIIKPTDRSGSRGINKVFNKEEVKEAVFKSIEVSFEKKAIIEEFVEGNEYSAEFISYNGEHHFLAATKKFTTGAPHFIETAHMEPVQLEKSEKENLINIIKDALDSLQVKNGASHSEFKIDNHGNIKIIEIGARMGGDCIGSDLVKISTGYDFVDMVIDVACGKAPSFIKVREPKAAFIKFIFNEEDLKLVESIKKNYPDKIYRISEIDKVGSREVVDSSTRYGYIILACDSVKEGYDILKLKDL